MGWTVDELESNLYSGWEMTTQLQKRRGYFWYPMANDFAYVIGRGNPVLGAGLLAALSPNKNWNDNRRIAVDASMGIFGGQVGDALRKARLIYEGVDPTTVLPMQKKTGHFYMNILCPSDPNWVTIDRHAIRAATWEWDNGSPRITEKQYGTFVLAYQKVAANLGITPSHFQAALWCWARER